MRFLCKFRNYYETEKENKAFFIILLIFTEQKEKKEPTSIYSTKNYNTKRKHTLPDGSFFVDGRNTTFTDGNTACETCPKEMGTPSRNTVLFLQYVFVPEVPSCIVL